MKKPAHLMLQWPAEEPGFWSGLIEDTDNSEFRQLSTGFAGRLRVLSFSLGDHQFIEVHLKRKSGAEFVAWIPRAIVIGIIEGKADMGAFYFGGGKKT